MDYELYHDESKEGGYWHGMLLVPIVRKKILSELLQEARQNTKYIHPIGIKKVHKSGKVYNCASAWVQIGVASLRSRTKNKPYPIFLGHKNQGKLKYSELNKDIYGAKFILFCERDKLALMGQHNDHGSKVETTFRMGLKGGLHFLGNPEDPINIVKLHFDGYEHYGRHIDKDRIIGRLSGLREYCSVSNTIDDGTSNHDKPESQDLIDCQLLQLTDLLIGCFRTALGTKTRDIHINLSIPARRLIERYKEGVARMQNSRWNNSISISQCYLENGNWKFQALNYQHVNDEQLAFPFYEPSF